MKSSAKLGFAGFSRITWDWGRLYEKSLFPHAKPSFAPRMLLLQLDADLTVLNLHVLHAGESAAVAALAEGVAQQVATLQAAEPMNEGSVSA